MDYLPPDSDPSELQALTHLSSRLLAHGFINKQLHLSTLFPPEAVTSQPGKASTSLLRHQAQTQSQLARCLWALLSARNEEMERTERLRGRLGVLQYELEREKGFRVEAQKERETMAKREEAERSKAAAATQALKEETQKHRLTTAELNKAKLAVQVIKTQSQHDAKRRELEIQQLHARLSSSHSLTPASGLQILNARTPRGGMASSSSNLLFEHALGESDRERRELKDENLELRTVLGEIGEWCEGMTDLARIGKMPTPDDDEAQVLLPNVPEAHLSLGATQFSPFLHSQLHHVRVQVLASFDKTDVEVQTATELNQLALHQEMLKRQEVEHELQGVKEGFEEAQEAIRASEQLVHDFTKRGVLYAAAEIPLPVDPSDDEDELLRAGEEKKKAAQKELEKKKAAHEEKKRRAQVKAMLSELGGDSPAPAPAKKVSKGKERAAESSQSSHHQIPPTATDKAPSTSALASAPLIKSRPAPASSSHPKTVSKQPQLSPLAENPSQPLPSTAVKSRSLANLLALGHSPIASVTNSAEVAEAERRQKKKVPVAVSRTSSGGRNDRRKENAPPLDTALGRK